MLTVCILAFAIALQTTPLPTPGPVPGQAPNDPTGRGNAVQQDATNQKSQPATPVLENPVAPPQEETAREEPATQNVQPQLPVAHVTVNVDDDWVFNALLVVVGFLQAGILWFTYKLTLPRLHVDGIYAEGFEFGKTPVFYVTVGNSGAVAATNVRISMKVEIGDKFVEYKGDQGMVVPARDMRDCHIPNRSPLTEDILQGLDQGTASLRITGQVKWKKQQIQYCYKYNRWLPHKDRPEHLPLFVPCDFDTRQDITLNLGAAMQPFAASLVPVKIPKPDQPKEPPTT